MTTTDARWRDDEEKVEVVVTSIRETFEGDWGDKASHDDIVFRAADGLGLGLYLDELREVGAGSALYRWEEENESPLAAGLGSLISDGLAVGATVPVEEIAGEKETEDWETRRAKAVLDILQDLPPTPSEDVPQYVRFYETEDGELRFVGSGLYEVGLTLVGTPLYPARAGADDPVEETVVIAADTERSAQTRAMAVTSLSPRGRIVDFSVREIDKEEA